LILYCVTICTVECCPVIVQIMCKYWYISGRTKRSDLSYSAQITVELYRQ